MALPMAYPVVAVSYGLVEDCYVCVEMNGCRIREARMLKFCNHVFGLQD